MDTKKNKTITITDGGLTAVFATAGGELRSLKDCSGNEYLWQGDPVYWQDRAPNLFPYVGRLFGGKYSYAGKSYEMCMHGFVQNMIMEVEEQSSSSLVLRLEDDEHTRSMYPFRFIYRIRCTVEGNRLSIVYTVENKDDKTMYFGIGGHPGFNIPFENGCVFEDYRLEFPAGVSPIRISLDEKCFRDGKDVPYDLESGRYINLRHDLFDNDAIILAGCGGEAVIARPGGGTSIRVTFPKSPYLGIWHTERADAPFVCLEPWVSLPAWQNKVTELETQTDLVTLGSGGVYENPWTIELIENRVKR